MKRAHLKYANSFKFMIVVIFLNCANALEFQCPNNYHSPKTQLTREFSCYRFVCDPFEPKSREDARYFCEHDGGDLAVLENEEEKQYILENPIWFKSECVGVHVNGPETLYLEKPRLPQKGTEIRAGNEDLEGALNVEKCIECEIAQSANLTRIPKAEWPPGDKRIGFVCKISIHFYLSHANRVVTEGATEEPTQGHDLHIGYILGSAFVVCICILFSLIVFLVVIKGRNINHSNMIEDCENQVSTIANYGRNIPEQSNPLIRCGLFSNFSAIGYENPLDSISSQNRGNSRVPIITRSRRN